MSCWPVSLAPRRLSGRPSHRQQPGATCWRVGSVSGRYRKRKLSRTRSATGRRRRPRPELVVVCPAIRCRSLPRSRLRHPPRCQRRPCSRCCRPRHAGAVDGGSARWRPHSIGSKDKRAVNLPGANQSQLAMRVAVRHAVTPLAVQSLNTDTILRCIENLEPDAGITYLDYEPLRRFAVLPRRAIRYLGSGLIRTALHRQRRGAKSLLRPQPMESSADRQKRTSWFVTWSLAAFGVHETNSHVTED